MELDNVCSLSESPALENHVPDNDPTVITCVNQQDVSLLQTEKLPNQPSEWKSSSDWLQYHSLHMSEQLSQHTAKIILQMDGGGACGQQQNSSEAVSELEFKLYQMIELYHGRIRWLNQGSRKVFGVIQGSRVGLIIDSSDANCSSTEVRLQELQTNLQCLIEEQLSTKKQLYLMSFGSDHSSLWDSPKDINASRLQEAHGWVRELRPMGNCNLLQALQRGLELGRSQLDSLVIILGSRTEQTPDAIAEYAEQCTLGQELSVHVVSYCSSSATSTVKRLAEVTHGRYHVVTASRCVVDDSTDVSVLRQEIQVARDLLSQTEALHQGHLEDMVTVLEDMTVSGTDGELQISAEREDLSLLLPCPADRSCLLNIKPSGVQDICSADWLHSDGLKAKRLGLYQVLSPNAYSPVEQYVPILNKTVTSTVHEKAMVQFEWHDGTVKNLHVDLPCIFNYQKQLQAVVCALERRVQWLSCGSRQIWGAVYEKRVQILVDMSLMNSSLSLPIDLFLKRLLEEQLSNTHSFNIITFGSSVTMWRERMAPPTPENLGDAWQWFQGVQYSGNSTTLDGLRQALAGILHDNSGYGGASSDQLTQGVYLLTSGLPVQEMGELCSYASESCSRQRLHLHVCLCTNKEEDKHPSVGYTDLHRTAGALRELAQAGRGRFHWCTEEGIMESDDITLLTEEMEQAASYWEKSFKLVEALTQRGSCTCPGEVVPPGQNGSALIPQHLRSSRDGPIPLPKPTALTIARLQAKSEVSSTARAYTPPGQSMSGKRPLSTKSMQKKCNYASQSFFYLEDGNLGVMFKSYPKPKSVRKSIPSVALPKREDLCSTKQWLKRYSVRRLKLDLHRLLSGPDCAHGKKLVPSVLKAVSARYCSIFPTVQINGAVKHLQLTPGELEDYLCQTQRLLQRYLQRLHWLLTGSRRVFGTVLEKDVCVLVDVSGSMAPSLAELKRDLSSLIWDQLHHNKIRFSLVAFSGEVRVWRTALQEPSEEQCLSAVEWVSQLDTHGCTNTLGALQTACGFEDRVGLYLLSDGKPDCSCSLVLRETKRLTTGRHITVHTVSYNCSDSAANDFLRDMAHQTGGRYHRSHDDADTLTTRLLASRGRDVDSPELPDFEGDDLRGLAREINKLGLFRKQAQSFRDIITKKTADTS